jgi:drug/metabolite transporter (DMT)-like permease
MNGVATDPSNPARRRPIIVEIAARLGVPVVAPWTSVFGAAVPLAPIGWELTRRPMHPSAIGVAAVLYLGGLVTARGILVWFHALRTLPVRIASASQYLQPLIGVAASAAWFGDPLGRWFVGGTALVLGGIALTAYGRRQRKFLGAAAAQPS